MSEHEMVMIELPWPDSGLSPNARINRYELARLRRTALDIGVVATREQWGPDCGKIYSLGKDDRIPLEIFFYPPDKRVRDLDNCHSQCKNFLDGICLMLDINDRVFAPQLQDWGPVVKGGRVLVVIGGDIIPKIGTDALDHYEDLFTKRTATGTGERCE